MVDGSVPSGEQPDKDNTAGFAWRAAGQMPFDRDRKAYRVPPLVRWIWNTLVVRTDIYGAYYRDRDGRTATYTVTRAGLRERGYVIDEDEHVLTRWELSKHLTRPAGDPRDALGVHFASAGNFGRCVAIDYDAHNDTSPETVERNVRCAMRHYEFLRTRGGNPLLFDYGNGSLHLWQPFACGVRADVLHHFARSLVADATVHGFVTPPETFPKQEWVSDCGHWLRLPGAHHRRPVWPRLWDGSRWLEEADAIAHILAIHGADPLTVIPAEIFRQCIDRAKNLPAPRQRPAAGRMRRERIGRPDGADLTIGDQYDLDPRVTWFDTGLTDPAFAGWTWVRGESYRHPGATNATSGTVGLCRGRNGEELFHCFTPNAPPFEEGGTYGKFNVLALLKHGADRSAAARSLAKQGYGRAGIHWPRPDALAPATAATPEGSSGCEVAKDGVQGFEFLGCLHKEERRHPKNSKVCARRRPKRPKAPPASPDGGGARVWQTVPARLYAEAQKLYCTRGARRPGVGTGSKNAGEQAIFKPGCASLSCVACHTFRRFFYAHPVCGHIAIARVQYNSAPFPRFCLWKGSKPAYRELLAHLRYIAKVTNTPAPALVWVHNSPGGSMTVLFVNGPDPDPSLRREGGKPWGDDPVEVSAEDAADAIAEAIDALPCKAYPGQRFNPFYVTPGLFPTDEEEVKVKERNLVLPYLGDGTPVRVRISMLQIRIAAATCKLDLKGWLDDETGVGVDDDVVYLLSAFFGNAPSVCADFWDRVEGVYPYDGPPRKPEECRQYQPAGWRPPPKPRKPRPRKHFVDKHRRVFEAAELPPSLGGRVIASVKGFANWMAVLGGDGCEGEIAAVLALSGVRGGLNQAREAFVAFLVVRGFDARDWVQDA